MVDFWQPDKIAHYKYCYDHTINAKKGTTLFWGLCIAIGVSGYKELYNDKILKKGTPNWGNVQANY